MKFALTFIAVLLSLSFAGSTARAFPQYYDIADSAKAQAEARQRNLPLAWLGSLPEFLTVGTPKQGSDADLTQMALATLQGNAVVIFFDGRNMAPVPPIIHEQFHIHDDGELANGIAWYTPKVVFSNPEITKTLGRVCNKEMGAGREAAINSAVQVIRNNSTALAPPPPPSTAPVAAEPSSKSKAVDTAFDIFAVVGWISNNILYFVMGLLLIVAGFVGLIAAKREK